MVHVHGPYAWSTCISADIVHSRMVLEPEHLVPVLLTTAEEEHDQPRHDPRKVIVEGPRRPCLVGRQRDVVSDALLQ